MPATKTVPVAQATGQDSNIVARLHAIPTCIYNDRGTQFISEFCLELGRVFGTQFGCSTPYHAHTQGVAERVNAVVGQALRCTFFQMKDFEYWAETLPLVELALNSLPNRSTGYSPSFLNYVYKPIVHEDLLYGNERTQQETVRYFLNA